MTRIGILTFHRAYNYGATLQAYALLRALGSLGAGAEIIDYRCEGLEEAAKLVKSGEGMGPQTAAKVAFRMLKHMRFDAFDRSFVPQSRTVRTGNELTELAESYDAVIVGSDQVWNYFITGDDGAYFLDFVPAGCRRYSYAASFNGSGKIAADVASTHAKDIASFDGVSLREAGGLQAIASAYGRSVRTDVDPVLLLGHDEWEALASPRLRKQPYAFMYLVGAEVNIRSFAENLCRERGLDLVDNKKSFEFLLHNGPSDFLSWILNADVVITNSFHGTAFSALLGKDAYFELGGVSRNLRAQGLLDAVGIEGREICGPTEPASAAPIDYAAVAQQLAGLREDSLAYLNGIVAGGGAA